MICGAYMPSKHCVSDVKYAGLRAIDAERVLISMRPHQYLYIPCWIMLTEDDELAALTESLS
ncbi:hypothetical protein Hanom_Chr05g00442541 [Helianthus anomalus]